MSADLLELENWVLTADPTGHGLRTRMALMDRLRASIITDLAVFEASAMWAIEGYASVNAWVADHGRCTRGEANRLVKTSRLLQQLPVTATAFRDGTLSAGQVSVIAANLTSRTVGKFAETETERVPLLAELDVNGTVMVMRTFAAHAQAELDDERDPEPEQDHLHFSPMLDNRFRLDGTLTGDNAKTVEAGLDACLPPLVEGEPVAPASQRYAEALVEMARRALQNVPVPARRSVDMTVLIDWQDYVNGGHRQIRRWHHHRTRPRPPPPVRRGTQHHHHRGTRRTAMDVTQSPHCHPCPVAGAYRTRPALRVPRLPPQTRNMRSAPHS